MCEAAGGKHSDDSQAALVEFEHEEGAATALLLSNSLLDDRPIFLVAVRSADTELHPKEAGTAVPKAGGKAREDGGSEAVESGDNRARGLSMWAGARQGLLEGGGALFSSAFTKANEATAAATQKMQASPKRQSQTLMQAAPALTIREYVCDTGMGPALRFAEQTDAKRRSKAILLERVRKCVFLFLLSTVVHFVACDHTHAHVCRLKICARARAALSVSRMLCWRLRPRTESSGQQICPHTCPICACENACA